MKPNYAYELIIVYDEVVYVYFHYSDYCRVKNNCSFILWADLILLASSLINNKLGWDFLYANEFIVDDSDVHLHQFCDDVYLCSFCAVCTSITKIISYSFTNWNHWC